jgi:hypothetical protein
LPFFIVTGAGFDISRFVRHFKQYASILVAPFSSCVPRSGEVPPIRSVPFWRPACQAASDSGTLAG